MKYLNFRIIFLVILTVPIVVSGIEKMAPPFPFNRDSTVRVTSFDIPISRQFNWPTLVGFQRTGKVDASFSCLGDLGYTYYPFALPGEWPWDPPTPSFATPPDSGADYLFGGSLAIGGIVGEDTNVSKGFDPWGSYIEYFPPNYSTNGQVGTITKFSSTADYSLRAEFTDTAAFPEGSYGYSLHRPLKLKIANRSHSWYTSPANNLIIYDMVITNVGEDFIDEGYFGFNFDCDIGDRGKPEFYYDDLAGSLREFGIGYMMDNNGDLDSAIYTPVTRLFAFKYLQNSFNAKDTNFNWWSGVLFSPVYDFGPRQRGTGDNPFRDFGTGGLGNPRGDSNMYYVMRHREWDYDQIYTYSIGDDDPVWLPPNPTIAGDYSDGMDTRFMMSIGPFYLLPDSSIRILYTTFTGDFVHTTGGSANYLPEDPATYLSLIYFNGVIQNSLVADSLAELLLDPSLPPTGLQLIRDSMNHFEMQWDPWVFGGVNGYKLFISEANFDLLPNPGAVPPWWEPEIDEVPVAVGRTFRLPIDSLDHEKVYTAKVAHVYGSSTGQLSAPIQFSMEPVKEAPIVPSKYAFANPGGPVKLRWFISNKRDVDHFNIYRFQDRASAYSAYHPFYDEGYQSQFIAPKDSFFTDDREFFYYAMEPYAVVDADDSAFSDFDANEGFTYIIAGADKHGFESEFSEPITANIVDEMTRDILLITYSGVTTLNNFTYMDSIYSFYDRILYGYDYDVYSHRDSTLPSVCPDNDAACMDWHDFMRFKMIIVDDRLSESFFSRDYQIQTDGFLRYLGYGGKLLYFGRFRGFGFGSPNGTNLKYVTFNNDFANDLMGIDSIFIGGERYYNNYTLPPFIDTLFGFIQSNSLDSLLPSVSADTIRDPFTPRLRNYWTPKTPPGVATFKINENSVPVTLFQSVYPEQSLQQNHIVGLRRDFPLLNTSAYTFGFHLWYMDSVEAKNLIQSIFADAPSALSAQTHIEPTEYRAIEAYALEPRFADIYLGNLASNRTVGEIVLGSLIINNIVMPVSTEILPLVDGYNGDVLKTVVSLHDFLVTFMPVWDTLQGNFIIDAQLNDGLSVQASGAITIFGHRRGDINNDDAVNILDLTLLVGYLFRGQNLPEPWQAAELDMSGSVNILDLTRLVDFIFRRESL